MIPYFTLRVIPIGPVAIQVWGLCVALGILAFVYIARRAARRRGVDGETMTDVATWAIVAGIVGARLGHVLLYDPTRFIADPVAILRVWEGGMSMFGSFIGGALAVWWFFRKHRIAPAPYLDAAAYAFPCAYGIGRIGCFLIHDHPGTLSDSLLAVKYPGAARLDHGLLLSLVGFATFAWFWWDERRGTPKGILKGFLPRLMVCYGTSRFILDFLRATDLPGADARYLGLTPAQYLSIALIAIGVHLLCSSRSSASTATTSPS